VSLTSSILAKWRASISPIGGRKSDGKCSEPRDLRHLQSCHFAVVFDTLTLRVEFQWIRGGIVPKLSEYVKVAEAADILGVSPGTIRTWAADGKIPMHRNPANGYRLFKRADLNRFLKSVGKPVKNPSHKSHQVGIECRSVQAILRSRLTLIENFTL